MLGGQPEDFTGTVAAHFSQPRSDARMVVAPLALEHAFVGHLVQDLMPEDVLAQPVEGVRVARMREFALDQRAQHVDRVRVQGRQRFVPEHEADDGGLLQRQLLGRRQTVQTRLKHAGQGGRDMGRDQLLRHHLPTLRAGDDRAVIDQHLHQFFHVERVALGCRGDQIAQCGGHRVEPLQKFERQFATGAFVQRLQVDSGVGRLDAGPTAAPLEQAGPRQAQKKHRHVMADLQQVVDEVERTLIGPMKIVQNDHRGVRFVLGHAAHRLRRRVEGAVAQLFGVVEQAAHVRAGRKVEPDQVAEHMGLRFTVVPEQRGDAVDELAARGVGVVAVGNLQPPRQHVAQQAVRLLFVERLGAPAKNEVQLGPRLGPVFEFVEQAALADARFGHHHHGHQLSQLVDGSERVLQLFQLGIATDHACFDALDPAGRDAKRARLGPQHEVGDQRFVAAFDEQRGLLDNVEHAPHMPVGVKTDSQPAHWRGLLHARSRVDRDAAHAVFFIDAPAQ